VVVSLNYLKGSVDNRKKKFFELTSRNEEENELRLDIHHSDTAASFAMGPDDSQEIGVLL
jgi:hypothetical protein